LPSLALEALFVYYDSDFSIDSTRIEFVSGGEIIAEIPFYDRVYAQIKFLPSELIHRRDQNYLPVEEILPSRPPDNFESFSFLEKLTERGTIKDKIILIGSTEENEDSHAISNEQTYPGLFVHASILNTILQQKVLRGASWADSELVAVILVAVFALQQKLQSANAWIIYPVMVLGFLALVNLVGIVAYFQGLQLDVALFNSAVVLAFLVTIMKVGLLNISITRPAYPGKLASEVGAIGSDTKRNQVFISYSRHDKKWLKKLQIMLKPLERNHVISIWDDTKVEPGTVWEKELEEALNSAKVAVLLVSQTYLASDFIMNYELVEIFKAAEEEGLIIIWIPLSASMYKETALADYQAVIDPKKPLDKLTPAKRKEQLVYIGNKIKEAIESL
ncbi:MAG: TIR domain-containing protein, partial [bacterium]